jgi:ATP adenylyltransferase
MDHLWSPWRFKFISEGPPKGGCVFCGLPGDPADDEKTLVVHRAAFNYVLLNLYPYTAGHLLIVPYAHASELNAVTMQTTEEMMALTRLAERALQEVYHPNGINLGMNLGAAAGAGIAGHIHMHVLPRWMGDANFLSTIGHTRMLPEELPVTWRKVKDKFEELTHAGA